MTGHWRNVGGGQAAFNANVGSHNSTEKGRVERAALACYPHHPGAKTTALNLGIPGKEGTSSSGRALGLIFPFSVALFFLSLQNG